MANPSPKTVTTRHGLTVEFRAIQPADVPVQLEYLTRTAAQTQDILTCADEFGAWTVEDQTRNVECFLADPGVLMLGAFIDKSDSQFNKHRPLIGVTTLMAHKRRRARHTASLGMSVDPDHQGQGLGRLMLARVLEWATDHPFIEKVCLCAHSENARAIALYESLGFVEEARRRGQSRLGQPTDPSTKPGEPVRLLDEVQMSRWVCEPNAKHAALDR